MHSKQEYCRASEIGAILGVSTARVYQLLFEHAETLPSFKLGHNRYIKRADWEAWMESHQDADDKGARNEQP